MFKKTMIKRTIETNSEVSNTPPNAKQDCSDVVHISVFFDGTGNNKDADEELKKWSNPARLWRNGIEFALDEAKKSPSNIQNNYAIYVSGVGTRFNGQLSIFNVHLL